MLDEAVDRTLVASRALVGVAARSFVAADAVVTLPQYRALVLLGSRGDQNVSSLAAALEVRPSSASRLCDRLISKGLIERAPSDESRREVTVRLSPAGRSLVRTVMQRRRRELRRILGELDPVAQRQLITAFGRFADACGEVPDDAWRLGWNA
jgi:DNA-binding MarR family transcriptional regulator